MSDPRNTLQSMYKEQHRYENFGNLITQLWIAGFRCHSSTIIDIKSPITAFSGLNGTGKSTIIQLAAVAYKSDRGPSFYVKDFLAVGTLDPAPFIENASVRFQYWIRDRTNQTLTISRDGGTARWIGYERRPKRHVVFVGTSPYCPRRDYREFFLKYAPTMIVESSSVAEPQSQIWPAKILNRHYDEVKNHNVKYANRRGRIMSVRRLGAYYSEANMGCGEGRVHYLVDLLESSPERSLFLLEEPESSLHPSAEREFGKYLVDTCIRKKHQIILTTHSEYILDSLPQASRIYLELNSNGLKITEGLTAKQVKSLLTQGHFKALTVLVEDECAKVILTECVRRIDPQYLQTIDIYLGGDAETIARTIRTLKDSNFPIAAVRDGDQPAIPSNNIFKLPGNEAPEKEIFKHHAVRQFIAERYGVSLDDFATSLVDVDHHEWISKLSQRVSADPNMLLGEIGHVYSSNISEAEAASLTNLLKEASQ